MHKTTIKNCRTLSFQMMGALQQKHILLLKSFGNLRPICCHIPLEKYRLYHNDFNSYFKSKVRRKFRISLFWGTCILGSGFTFFYLQKKYAVDGFKDISQLNSFSSQFYFTWKDLFTSFSRVVDCSTIKTPDCEISGLPIYTASDVSMHDTVEKKIWVSYKCGVYDITDFIKKHPGGDKILMAAGGALEPFWEQFAVHKDPKILNMLEEYRIGNLHVEDRGLSMENMDDPFAEDPSRHPNLQPRSVKPFNAEPPLELLVENFITPNDLFFVRNHLPVPLVDPNSYELEISGIGVKSFSLNLNDLKTKFKKHTVTSTIQCAGNRRSELNKVKEVKGLNWGSAAISNAEWSGVKLIDVLKFAGVNIENPKIKHIQFEGLDTDPSNVPYGASIPADKGLDPKSDIILAYEMNGQILPRDHGFPIRVIVPGIVGARNVKWLGRIILSEDESDSHWQKNDYKGFSPNINWENVDFSSAPAIQDLPVNSAICKPSHSEKVKIEKGFLPVAGYAWSGGGRKIVRVDISVDGGKTWHTAKLKQDSSPLYRCWSWTLWTIEVPIPVKLQKSGKEIEIICKAIDSSYNVQPDTFSPIWNVRGVLGNAWHKINIKIK